MHFPVRECYIRDGFTSDAYRSTMKNLKLLLSVNRFYPEVGGAETNLYFQANKLAEKFGLVSKIRGLAVGQGACPIRDTARFQCI